MWNIHICVFVVYINTLLSQYTNLISIFIRSLLQNFSRNKYLKYKYAKYLTEGSSE